MIQEKQAAAARNIDNLNKYYLEIPIVVSTFDGKGRLVGFSRLIEANGSAQYSFIVKHEEKDVTVSGVITNTNGKLLYSDDYNTPSDIRTGGEIVHSKPAPNRLNLVFIVTSTSSDHYRIGDTFTASFVLSTGFQ